MRNLLDEDGENMAVRSFLMQYSCDRSISCAAMAQHMKRSGFEETTPDFVHGPAHMNKAMAQAWLRHLFSLEPK